MDYGYRAHIPPTQFNSSYIYHNNNINNTNSHIINQDARHSEDNRPTCQATGNQEIVSTKSESVNKYDPFQITMPVRDPRIEALCKKYNLPAELCEHPAFQDDFAPLENMSNSTPKLLDAARKVFNKDFYFLRPSSRKTEDRQSFVFAFQKESGKETQQVLFNYSAKNKEWGVLVERINGIDQYEYFKGSLSDFIKENFKCIKDHHPLTKEYYPKALKQFKEDAEKENICKKYNLPAKVVEDPGFVSDFAENENMYETTKKRLNEAHEKSRNTNIYLLRPSSGKAANKEHQLFIFAHITPNGVQSNIRVGYAPKTDEWLYIDDQGNQKEGSGTYKGSVQSFITEEIGRQNNSPIKPWKEISTLQQSSQANNCNPTAPSHSNDKKVTDKENVKVAKESEAEKNIPDLYKLENLGEAIPKDTEKLLADYFANLSQPQYTQKDFDRFNETGSAKESEKFQNYVKEALKNNPIAQLNAGYCLEFGRGTKINLEEAIKYYFLSAKQNNKFATFRYYLLTSYNNPVAQEALASFYQNGEGTEKNLYMAFMTRKKAADSGYYMSQLNLAECYRCGIGTKVNSHLAEYYKNLGLAGQQRFYSQNMVPYMMQNSQFFMGA